MLDRRRPYPMPYTTAPETTSAMIELGYMAARETSEVEGPKEANPCFRIREGVAKIRQGGESVVAFFTGTLQLSFPSINLMKNRRLAYTGI